jgi:integrase
MTSVTSLFSFRLPCLLPRSTNLVRQIRFRHIYKEDTPIANRAVALVRYCKTPKGWRRLPVVFGRNGKVRPDYVLLKGQPVACPVGHYEVRFFRGRKTVYRNVGENPQEALAEAERQANLLVARDVVEAAGAQLVEPDPERKTIAEQQTKYIRHLVAHGHQRASETFGTACREFRNIVTCAYPDQITRGDIDDWYLALQDQGNSQRTIHNKHVSMFAFLKWCGVDTKALATKAPDYPKKSVKVYRKSEVEALLRAVADSPYRTLVLTLLWMTGLRMEEAMYLEWGDLQLDGASPKLSVFVKDDLGFRIKDRAEREVPLPAKLVELLRAHRAKHPGTRFVLGTRNDTPNTQMLQMLKRVARRTGLNCGNCAGCLHSKARDCESWTIKKFRSTYTTTMLRSREQGGAGLDVRTVMQLTGHADLATVLLYIAPAEDAEIQRAVNAVSW